MVRLFSSSAIRNPNTEIIRAVVFKNHGIVRTGMLVGGMLYEITNPAKMLPNARRLIGFMRSGSFSLMEIRGENAVLLLLRSNDSYAVHSCYRSGD